MNDQNRPDGLDEVLVRAIAEGDDAAAEVRIPFLSSLDIVSNNGWTFLMLAILNGRNDIVKHLLEAGANPDLTTSSAENAARCAATVAIANGQVQAVRELLKWGVDLSKSRHGSLKVLEMAKMLAKRPFKQSEMAEIVRILESALRDEHAF